MATMPPMTANLALAMRLERAEGSACLEFVKARQQVHPELGAAWTVCGGAWLAFDGIDSPITQGFGLGLFEEATAADLDAIESFFSSRSSATVLEVSPFAGVSVLATLCDRGYRPIEASNVLYRPVEEPEKSARREVSVRIAGADEMKLWTEVSARGWSSEYPEIYQSILQFGEVFAARQHTTCFLGEIDGQSGAAGTLSLHEGVALFGGAATIPALRRRGLQTALLGERMRYALAMGCDLAMMVAEPGSLSQRNAERLGFRIAYTRIKWSLPAGTDPAVRPASSLQLS